MSLLSIRRKRKKNWIDSKKGLPAQRLIMLLVITSAVIWYLGWRY